MITAYLLTEKVLHFSQNAKISGSKLFIPGN